MKRAIALLIVTWAGVVLAQYKEVAAAAPQGAAASAQKATTTIPPYTPVRWNEDYSYLAKSPDADFFDPIKYMPLNESGDIYLSVGGQARYRYEYFNNFNFSPPSPPGPPQDETGYHLIRLLLHGDLHIGKNVRVFAQGKSAMEDGREGGPRAVDADELDVQQLFVDVRLDWGKDWNSTIRAGRQDLLYGAQRLISPLDWTNARRTFEGVGFNSKLGRCAVDVFWVRPVDVEKEDFNDGDDTTSFAGLYSTTQLPEVFEKGGTKLEAYFLALNRTNAQFAVNAAGPGVDEDRYTVGARFSSNPKPWDLDVEAAYQFGKFDDGDVSAWMFATEAGYTLANCPATPRIFIGFDIASGDEDADDNDLETFNQLFPLGHAYFGFIDVIGRQNIIDLHPGIDFTLIQNAP